MQHMSFKKEDDEHHERVKKRSDQRSQARMLKWRKKLFIHQWISSCIACFSRYLRDEDEVTWRRWEVTKTRETRVFTQLLNTISHAERKNYSLFHCQRRRTRWFQAWMMKCWIIACAVWCIISWRRRKTRFITQSCFFLKQCSHLQARSMRARHMWVITTLRWWTQQQHQIFWSWWFNIRQHLLKHTEINMFITNHEFSHQRNRREKSRRSRRDRRCSNDNAKKNVHFKKMSKLHEHVSMISVSVNAATYHDSDDDDDDVDIAMSFMLTHELTCITTTLQRKKLIS